MYLLAGFESKISLSFGRLVGGFGNLKLEISDFVKDFLLKPIM
jgi:hypothetical protein